MKENDVSKTFRLRFFIFIAIAVAGVFIFVSAVNSFVKKDNIPFNQGWDMSFRDSFSKNVDLYRYRISGRIKKGEAVLLDNRLPETIGGSMILSFRAEYSYVRVYVDGKCIYSYMGGKDNTQITPGDAVHMVSLPESAAGKLCRVALHPGYDDAFNKLPLFTLIPARQISASYMTSDIYTNLVGIFLFMTGLILLITSIVLFFSRRKWNICFSLGLLSFLVGMWALCRGGVIELYSLDFSTNTRIEHLSLFFAVLPFMGLTISIRGTGPSIKKRICTAAGIAIYSAFYIFALINEYFNSVNIVHMYSIFQLMTVGCGFLVIYGTKSDDKDFEDLYLNNLRV